MHMKERTDFVTYSSSSPFTLEINVTTVDEPEFSTMRFDLVDKNEKW